MEILIPIFFFIWAIVTWIVTWMLFWKVWDMTKDVRAIREHLVPDAPKPKPLPTRPHDALGKEVVAVGNNFSGILKEVRGNRGYIENSYGTVQDFPLSCIEQPY